MTTLTKPASVHDVKIKFDFNHYKYYIFNSKVSPVRLVDQEWVINLKRLTPRTSVVHFLQPPYFCWEYSIVRCEDLQDPIYVRILKKEQIILWIATNGEFIPQA